MENADSYSDSYLTVESMIRRGELSLSDLEHLLETLREQENISAAEQQTLLALAWEVKIENKSSP